MAGLFLENYEDGDPFVIGLYVGMPKPTNTDDYLEPLIDDILTIRRDGIVFDCRSIELTILNFVSDTPTRSSWIL